MQSLNLDKKGYTVTFLIIIIVELCSFWAFSFPLLNTIVFLLITAATFILSLKRLEIGFWIVSGEIFIGSFGYLFFFDAPGLRISIRLGIFLAIFLAWILNALKNKKNEFISSPLWKSWILFICFLIIGIILGMSNGNNLKDIFYDANAYLYYGMLFVAFSVIKNWKQVTMFLQILCAAVTAIALKTIVLLFFFSHVTNEGLLRLIYRWVRDTRIGEISPIIQNFYRVFFQSHIWMLFSLILFILLLLFFKKDELDKKTSRISWFVTIISSTTIIISFSRSLWLSLAVTIVLITIYLYVKENFSLLKISKIVLFSTLMLIAELGLITGLVNIKLPSSGNASTISVASLIRDRVSNQDESAVVSRFELLRPLSKKIAASPIIGSGFGTAVSYKSQDPRASKSSDGLYSTYSFGWGYLDISLKIGLLGLFAYLFFIYQLLRLGIQALKLQSNRVHYAIIIGLLFCIVALLITHLTTPFLNHPLGIYLIVVCAAVFNVSINRKEELTRSNP